MGVVCTVDAPLSDDKRRSGRFADPVSVATGGCTSQAHREPGLHFFEACLQAACCMVG